MGQAIRRGPGNGVALARELEVTKRNFFLLMAGVVVGAATAFGAGIYARRQG